MQIYGEADDGGKAKAGRPDATSAVYMGEHRNEVGFLVGVRIVDMNASLLDAAGTFVAGCSRGQYRSID